MKTPEVSFMATAEKPKRNHSSSSLSPCENRFSDGRNNKWDEGEFFETGRKEIGAHPGSERLQDAESPGLYCHVSKRWAMTSRLSLLNNAAGWLASSFLFARGKRLFEANRRCWNLSMTK